MSFRRRLIVESMIDAGLGLLVAISIAQLASHFAPEIREYFWKDFDWQMNGKSNFIMTIIITLLSFIRHYFLRCFYRRVFNEKRKKGI